MADLRVKVTVDNADAKRKLDEVGKAADDLKAKQSADAKTFLDGMNAKADLLIDKLGKVALAGAAAMGAIGAAAVDSYAQYEQLVGGVETLFGTRGAASVEEYAQITGQSLEEATKSFQEHLAAQDDVFKNADSAYYRAGVSANKYMEQATSFSASLVSSLGGDVNEAARLADTAIVDMADNANKMGTDLGSIQDAYQGFAKQNYTMLDNLKLGYGGTKTEMERLLQDAERIKAAHGEMADYSIDSFADIVEAIHVVQDEMGVTGTTADEAEHTISGSVGMMKSAWEDWLTALGRDDVDISQYTSRLLDSIGTVADNIGPRLQIIATTMLRELPGVFAQVIEQVPGMLTGFADAVAQGLEANGMDGAADVVRGLGDALSGAFQWLVDNGDTVAFVLGAIGGALLAIKGYAVVQGIITGISSAFMLFNAVLAANPIVLVVGLIGMLVGGLVALMATNEDFRNHVVESWNQLQALAGTVFGAICAFFTETVPAAIEGMLAFFSALPGNVMAFLQAVIANVAAWATFMANKAMAMGQQFLANVGTFFAQLPGRIGSFLSTVISRVGSWVGQMASNAGQAASQFASRLISGLQSIPGRVFSIGTQIINGIRDGVLSAAGNLVSAVQNAVGGAINAAKSFLGIASPSKLFRDEVGRWIPLGVAEGIERESDALDMTIERVLGIDLTPMGWTGQIVAAQEVQPGYGGITQNVTNNVYEREDAYVASTIFSRALMSGVGA